MNDAEYRAFLDLLMRSDPDPVKASWVKNLANREAQQRGFANWFQAYHLFNTPPCEGEHTGEPWRVVAYYRIHGYAGGGNVVVGQCGDPPQRDYGDETIARWAADARRIVMCVNAMEGMGEMKPGSVRRLVEALKVARADILGGWLAQGRGVTKEFAEQSSSGIKAIDEALRELDEEVSNEA